MTNGHYGEANGRPHGLVFLFERGNRPDRADVLAKLKSRDELLADILGLLLAPITNVASALGAQGSGLASVIQQISEKGEEG